MSRGRRIETEAADGLADAAFDLAGYLPYLLNIAATEVSRGFARLYDERHGLGIPEWRVLAWLAARGAMSGRALVDITHMHKTKVSRAASSLARRGLIARRRSSEDQRESILSLTEAGMRVHADLVPLAIAYARELTAGLDPADIAAFLRVVAHVTREGERLARGFKPSA